ncbi:unnamed protein product, partial [Meganyctiphanes norvegica]
NSVIKLKARGHSDERLLFNYYLKENNELSDIPIFPDLKKISRSTDKISYEKGKVIMFDEEHAGFRILTRHCSSGPGLGIVVTGLDVLEYIIDHYLASEYDSKTTSSRVIISESGLVIDDQLV